MCAGSLLTALLLAAVAAPVCAASPVLVTWSIDTEADLAGLDLVETLAPSTVFVSGAFAERHPRRVADLARRAAVGALSYGPRELTALGDEELHRELTLAKLVLEDVLATPVTWFRAPALRKDARVSRKLAAVGFEGDSSDLERWTNELYLLALPISVADGSDAPVSDYEIFERRQMHDDEALAWLLARLDERAASGRPLVVLLHPRIAAGHADVLGRFVEQARAAGAIFVTADGWREALRHPTGARRALWVDLSQGAVDAGQLADDVRSAGMTDVFVQARDPDGLRYYPEAEQGAPRGEGDFSACVQALGRAGVRVHAWISVNRDPWQAAHWPERAMVSIDGSRSPAWVAPDHPDVRANLLSAITGLLDRYQLAGVHLDYLRYPDLDHDFRAPEVAAFRRAQGVAGEDLKAMFDEHYNAWIARRTANVREELAAVRELLEARQGTRPELSVAVFADAATSYRVMETMGQDLSALAPLVDALVPMAYVREQRRWPGWVKAVAAAVRYRGGDTPVIVGLEAYERPPLVTYTSEEFAEVSAAAAHGFDGVAFYHYGGLFGHAGRAASLVEGAREAALAALAGGVTNARLAEPDGAKPRAAWPRYFLLGAVALVAGVLAARGRARRGRAGAGG